MADVVLVCPPGAQDAPISHGAVGFLAYREDVTDPRGRWLVRVPADVAPYFIGKAGFWPVDPIGDAWLIPRR